MRVSFILLTIGFFNLLSCTLSDRFDEEPMYLEIKSLDLATNSDQGFPSHDLRDVWVFADGFSIGVFEVSDDKPARIPILSGGKESVDLLIFGGVRENGRELAPAQYPYYQVKEMNLAFEAGRVIPMDLVFNYTTKTRFAVLEGFEGTQIFTEDLDDDPSTRVYASTDSGDVLYGSSCGRVDVDGSNSLFSQTTLNLMSTDIFGTSKVYLEADFKSEVDFALGYIGYANGLAETNFSIFLKSTDEWTKMYLDLSREINGGSYDEFKLLIGGLPQSNAGKILIDNIKLLYIEN